MYSHLLTTEEAARRLAISRATLYDWLRQSNERSFAIRGQSVTIDYFQGGGKGQGRIKIEAAEIERLLSLMRVVPMPAQKKSHLQRSFPYGISMSNSVDLKIDLENSQKSLGGKIVRTAMRMNESPDPNAVLRIGRYFKSHRCNTFHKVTTITFVLRSQFRVMISSNHPA